jgi:hypothetical protein
LKRYLLFLIPLVIVGASTYFILKNELFSSRLSPFDYVPGNASIVYETNKLLLEWQNLKTKRLWKTFNQIPSIRVFGIEIDSLLAEGALGKVFSNRSVTVSFHVISNSAFDALFIMDMPLGFQRTMTEFLKKQKQKGWSEIQKREYRGETISEVSLPGETTLSYVVLENLFIFSSSSILVEDVIRLKTLAAEVSSFKESNPELFELNKLQQDNGNLYINYNNLAFLLTTLVHGKEKDYMSSLGNSAKNVFQDIRIDNDRVLLSGFSFPFSNRGFLNTFKGQQASGIVLHNYVPNRAGIMVNYSFSDPSRYAESLTDYAEEEMKMKNAREELKNQYSFEVSEAFKWMKGSAALACIETVKKENLSKLLIIPYSDQGEMLKQLNQLAEQSSLQTGDSIYAEQYGNYLINDLEVREIPLALFGRTFEGFDHLVYCIFQDVLLAADDINTLKTTLRDLELDNTWGKTLRLSKFIDQLGEDANHTVVVNTPKAWGIANDKANNTWKEFLAEEALPFQAIDLIAVQNLYIDNRFYTSLVLNQDPNRTSFDKKSSYNADWINSLDTIISTKPLLVKDFVSGSFHVMVQDKLNNLYRINQEGQIQWKDSLSQQVIPTVEQLDFYKNKKLQSAIPSNEGLYIFDRLGNAVSSTPYTSKNYGVIEFFSIVDYDNSKNYRFFLANEKGELFLLNQNGRTLDGWNGKRLGGSLALAPFHLRIGGRDYMVAIEKEGIVNVFNRNGTLKRGFPIDLKTTLNGEVFIDEGSGSSNTIMHLVSTAGEMIQLNMQGKGLRRQQLYKPDAETEFLLVRDALNKSYIIIRKGLGSIAIIDRKGEILFEKDYLETTKMSFQYYLFDITRQCVVINDPVQEYSYLFDIEGNLLNNRPLNSSFDVGMLYFESENKYRVYHTFGNEIRVSSFSW